MCLAGRGLPRPDIVQLICRWMCPDSLRIYSIKGLSEHNAWIERSYAARVTATRGHDHPVVDVTEALANMHLGLNRIDRPDPPTSATLAPFSSTLSSPPRILPPPVAPPQAPRPASRAVGRLVLIPQAHVVEPTTYMAALEPLAVGQVVGRLVLVPRTLWPSYACHEQEGRGWVARVISATGRTAVVSFLHSHTRGGVPYADVRLPLGDLQPLTAT